jgi:hypothetical protein
MPPMRQPGEDPIRKDPNPLSVDPFWHPSTQDTKCRTPRGTWLDVSYPFEHSLLLLPQRSLRDSIEIAYLTLDGIIHTP